MTTALVLALALPAQAAGLDAVIRQLEAQGYTITERERTWLGRIRLEAKRGAQERELVLNPSTGEILRDYWEEEDEEEEGDD